MVRAAYAASDSDPDSRRPRSVARYAPSNSNRPKSAISPSRNFSYDATVSARCDRRTFSASFDQSQARTKKPQRSRGRLQSVTTNSASARNARILILDVSVKRCLEAAFNSVSQSAAPKRFQRQYSENTEERTPTLTASSTAVTRTGGQRRIGLGRKW